MSTGEVEVFAEKVSVLNTADPLPFPLSDKAELVGSLFFVYDHCVIRTCVF